MEHLDKSLAESEGLHADCLPNPDYFAYQTEIRPRMRTILFTWLTEVHMYYKLMKDVVLWTALQICDRYLSEVDTYQRELQLMGCAALWIASKYHDLHPPKAYELVRISDNAFSKSDLIEMETCICDVLTYQFTIPTAYHFLERYTDIILYSMDEVKAQNQVKWLARYAMERFNLNSQALEYCPSLLAAGALYVALKITSNEWTTECAVCSGYSIPDFLRRRTHSSLNLFEMYIMCTLDFDSVSHQVVIDKYKSSKRGSVSTLLCTKQSSWSVVTA